MAHHEIKFEGIVELKKGLRERVSLDAVKRVVRQNTADMQEKAKNNAQFRGHYNGSRFVEPTGKLRDSIGVDLQDGGLTGVVEPTAEYAAYVELGTRKMEAQPYLKPAWEEQKEQFEKDMQKLVK